MKLPDKPTVETEKYVSFRDYGYCLMLMFASEKGKQEFMHDWPQLKQILETYANMQNETVAEMSTPNTERLPFVAP
jgi:hypothetical protein